MARDDEFRKVAEDIGALARSLGRDFREAVDQAIRGGYPPGRAVRDGLRGLTDEARRGMRHGWSTHHGRRRAYWGQWGNGPGGWGNQWWGPPAEDTETEAGGPPGPGGGPARPPNAPPWVRPNRGRGRPWAGPCCFRRPETAKPGAGASPARHPRQRSTLPPVRHRWDASTVAGLLAVLFGVAWLIGATSILHVSIEAVVAVGLMLLGASLVVTGRTDWSLSRRSWPVWLGIGLIGVLVVTSSAFGLGGALDSVSFGNKTVTSQGGALPTGTVHGGFGNLIVDLSTADKAGSVKVVSVAGDTTVNLPSTATVDVDARVVGGQICLNGRDVSDGLGAQYHADVPPSRSTTGPAQTITLHVHQVFGQILINGTGCAR